MTPDTRHSGFRLLSSLSPHPSSGPASSSLLTTTRMTFADLKALHAIIGNAIDDMESIYGDVDAVRPPVSSSPHQAKVSCSTDSGYASPPPSPSVSSYRHFQSESSIPLDFPSLDLPLDASSPSETLTSHPVVISAINRIISAAGQLSATVQTPFLTLCDASMGVSINSSVFSIVHIFAIR